MAKIVFQVYRQGIIRIIVFSKYALLGLLMISCISSTNEDLLKLHALKEKYKGRCDFQLEEGLYLTVRSLDEDSPSKQFALEIYDFFWFENHKKRRATDYIYLNILNKSGEFQFQVAWDESKKDYIFSNRPYY